MVRKDGLSHEEEKRRAYRVESPHGPEQHVLLLEASALNQGTHERGRQRTERRQGAEETSTRSAEVPQRTKSIRAEGAGRGGEGGGRGGGGEG